MRDLGIDGRVILNGSCGEDGNESSGYLRDGDCLHCSNDQSGTLI
jgi:hypothetical protein